MQVSSGPLLIHTKLHVHTKFIPVVHPSCVIQWGSRGSVQLFRNSEKFVSNTRSSTRSTNYPQKQPQKLIPVRSHCKKASVELSTLEYNFLKTIRRKQVLFCGATDNPVLDFWWCLLWDSKPEWAALFTLGYMHNTFPEIHLWCDTCQPLDASMATKPILSMYLWAGIGGAWNQDLSCWRWTL